MQTENDSLVEREYVFCGFRRSTTGKKLLEIRLIRDDGSLFPATHYPAGRKGPTAIGSRYKARFVLDESGAAIKAALDRSTWAGPYPNKDAIIEWEALSSQCIADFRREKLESDAGRVSEIETVMRPLREKYQALNAKLDQEGMRALEAAVLTALRTRLRTEERRKNA